jgi:putative transposase
MSERRFRRTQGGVCSLGLHLVWCQKYRRRVLGGRVAARCGELLEQVAAERSWEIVAKEVMPDHVHLFVRVDSTDAPAAVVRAFKGRTARVLRAEFPYLRRFAKVLWWSPSHFAASVGYVSESTVRRYIEHQWDSVA